MTSSMIPQRPPRRRVNGLLLLDKPPGISSNRALQIVRRAYHAAKGGHTGNLDVAATGLLPLCFGEATKISNLLLDSTKRYLAEVQFGCVTTTGDLEGEVIATSTALPTSIESIEAALVKFRGVISQVPPMYSALKHHGQPLYKLARQGIDIERAPRRVEIFQLILNRLLGDRLHLDITCSKGTYIRSLAIDLGASLGCGGTLANLRRIKVGPFEIGQAHSIEIFSADKYPPAALDELLLPLDQALLDYQEVHLSASQSDAFMHGQVVQLIEFGETRAARVYGHARLLGLGMIGGDGRLQPTRVMHLAAE